MPRRRIKPGQVGRPGVPIRIVERLNVRNSAPEDFRRRLLEIPLLAYEVERLADGRRILITKPGSKKADDLMVWVYEGPEGISWRPSHGLIYNDLEDKIDHDLERGAVVVEALEEVFKGAEPEDILRAQPDLGKGLPGLSVDLVIKAYK